MSEVRNILAQLGLSEYAESFLAEGFDSWDTLADITESDFNDLNVKLGHRRKIQRAIADWRAQVNRPPLPLPNSIGHTQFQSPANPPSLGKSGSAKSDESSQKTITQQQWSGTLSTDPGGHYSNPETNHDREGAVDGLRTKRKYRRHPKPDKNAPQRPQSAYVIFSNHLRDQLKGQELSFTEMAKIVGERWQVLDTETRETFESQASAAKEEYYAQLAEYKKTDKYAQYQQYLQDFKEKYGDQSTDEKRTKLRTEASNSTQSSHDGDNPMFRPISEASVNSLSTPSETHLDTYSHTTSPVSSLATNRNASPFDDRDAGMLGPSSRRNLPTNNRSLQDLSRHSSAGSSGDHASSMSEQSGLPYSASPYSTQHPLPPASTLYQTHSHSSGPPTLSRGPSSNMSMSSQDLAGSPNSPLGGIMDAPRSGRVLPALGPSMPPGSSSKQALEHRSGPPRVQPPPSLSSSSSASVPEDPRHSASLAALLRAGELAAREADRNPTNRPRDNS